MCSKVPVLFRLVTIRHVCSSQYISLFRFLPAASNFFGLLPISSHCSAMSSDHKLVIPIRGCRLRYFLDISFCIAGIWANRPVDHARTGFLEKALAPNTQCIFTPMTFPYNPYPLN